MSDRYEDQDPLDKEVKSILKHVKMDEPSAELNNKIINNYDNYWIKKNNSLIYKIKNIFSFNHFKYKLVPLVSTIIMIIVLGTVIRIYVIDKGDVPYVEPQNQTRTLSEEVAAIKKIYIEGYGDKSLVDSVKNKFRETDNTGKPEIVVSKSMADAILYINRRANDNIYVELVIPQNYVIVYKEEFINDKIDRVSSEIVNNVRKILTNK